MLKQIEDSNEVRCAGQEGIFSDVTGKEVCFYIQRPHL